jgi:hypothetical protein
MLTRFQFLATCLFTRKMILSQLFANMKFPGACQQRVFQCNIIYIQSHLDQVGYCITILLNNVTVAGSNTVDGDCDPSLRKTSNHSFTARFRIKY